MITSPSRAFSTASRMDRTLRVLCAACLRAASAAASAATTWRFAAEVGRAPDLADGVGRKRRRLRRRTNPMCKQEDEHDTR